MTRRKTQLIGIAAAAAAAAVIALAVSKSGQQRSVVPIAETGERDAAGGSTGLRSPRRPELPEPQRGTGEHTLEGSIEDGSQSGIGGAVITAHPEEMAVRSGDGGPITATFAALAVSADDGSFRLQGLEPGRYRLGIRGTRVFDSEVRFVEVPGPPLTVVGLRRVSIRGRVRRGGTPTAARVAAMPEEGGDIRWVRADADGRFEIGDLAEGAYRIAAFDDELAAPAKAVHRSGPGPHPDVELSLMPALNVRGRVIDDDGEGLPAEVILDNDGGEVSRVVVADSDGTFVIPAVLAGPWRASARLGGYLPIEAVSFVAGSDYQPLLRLSRGGVLRGRVVSEAGPVSGAELAVVGQSPDGTRIEVGGSPGSARPTPLAASAERDPRLIPTGELGVLLGPLPKPTAVPAAVRVAAPLDASAAPGAPRTETIRSDAEGRFEITGLEPGRYRVLARHPGYADGQSAEVPLDLRRPATVDVRLSRGVHVRGRVVARGGGPLRGATVAAFALDSERPGPMVTTDSGGRYRLGPVSDRVRLVGRAPGFGSAEAEIDLRGTPVGGERQLDLELVRADAEITGRVRDASGFAVAGARISISGQPQALAFADRYGRFSLSELGHGAHRVVVRAPGYPELQTRVETGSPVELTLAPGGAVDVAVRDAHTREWVQGARVMLQGRSSPSAAMTDERGRASFDALVPGRYRVAVERAGYAAGAAEVDVAGAARPGQGPSQEVVVAIERGATLAGVVRDRNGERVGGAVVRVGDQRAVADRRGQFRMTGVPTGAVELIAEDGELEGAMPLTLAPGDELVTLQIVID